jgi:hypothetical protein
MYLIHKNFKILSTVSLIILMLSFSFIPVSLVMQDSDNSLLFSIKGSDSYFEDFYQTTYRDFLPTTAYGWGGGTISNRRNFTLTSLDSYATAAPIRDIDIDGRHAYIAHFDGTGGTTQVTVLDISDPSNMVADGISTDHLSCLTLAADGGVLYTGQYSTMIQDGFWAYNISDPTNPAWQWGRGIDNFATDIDIEGHMIYYTCYDRTNSLRSIYAPSLSLFESEQITSNWGSTQALGLEVDGHLAYIAASTEGFYILNMTNPHTPVEYSHIDTPGNATDVIIDGHFAYLADGEAGVHVLDISNPYDPVIIGTYDTDGYAGKLAKQGKTIFVADRNAGVGVLDVADPSNPTYIYGVYYSYTWDVDLFGGDIFIATDAGVYSFRFCAGDGITSFNSANFLTVWDTLEVWDIRIQGDIAYIAGGLDGFYTLNVRDPENPYLLDHFAIMGRDYRKIDVNGQFAYVVDSVYMDVFKISDPSNIQHISEIWSVGGLTDVFLQGSIVFLSWGGGTLPVLNATFPMGLGWPDLLDEPFITGNVSAVWAQGRHVYTGNSANGAIVPAIYVHSTTDLTNLVEKDSFTGDTWMADLYVDGDIAYFANRFYTIIMDVTDSHNIGLLDAIYDASANTIGVWGFGPYFMTADHNLGVKLYDASNPFLFFEIGHIPQIIRARQITIHGDYTYVANQSSLSILRHYESAADTYEAGISTAQSTEIDDVIGLIYEATLTANDFVPQGTIIDYYMSADGGAHWEPVTPGVLHEFVYPGDDLRWKADLGGPTHSSPHIYNIAIDYNFNLAPSIPSITDLGDSKFTGIFKVDWSDSTDDVSVDHYILEMSDTLSFTTVLKEWTAKKSSKLVFGLGKGTFYFRVRAVDNEGLSSEWSLVDQAVVRLSTAISGVIFGGALILIILAIVIPLVLIRRKKKIPTR